jgi:hypothetical protein
MKKRGQLTIFIIISIVLVLAIIIYFLVRGGLIPQIGGKGETNPNQFFQTCIEESLMQNIQTISEQGGYIANQLNVTFQFTDEEPRDIAYLCYQKNYYLSCINQEPVLIQHLKKEIKKATEQQVKDCFEIIKKNLEDSGETVEANYRDFDVSFQERKVILNLDGEITATKSGETTKYSGLKAVVATRFYDLAVVAQEIASQEARFCSFEQLGYMLIYPEFNIDKFRTGNSDTIYTVAHRETGERFRFAVRSCVLPPGF